LLQAFEEESGPFETVLDALQQQVMQLRETRIDRLIQLLQDLGVVDLLGEEVDEGGGGGAAVEEAEELLAGVQVFDVCVEGGVLGSSIRLILELYCRMMSRPITSACSYATSTKLTISPMYPSRQLTLIRCYLLLTSTPASYSAKCTTHPPSRSSATTARNLPS
jgi:hypothetical protein